ncbi:MAG: hypothetical protein JXP73_13965 [Deltaproteobacteria bacterium]|nr:hypothetical protein [Deltaproteobacteria bacterium]
MKDARGGGAWPAPAIAAYRARLGQRVPLSFGQYRLWYLQQLYRDDVMYNLPHCFRVDGPLDLDVLRRALCLLTERHEPLRTRVLATAQGVPFQHVEQEPRVDFESADMNQPTEQATAAVDRLVQAVALTPFELHRAPLLRTRCYRVGADAWILLFVQHHISTDHFSWAPFFAELGAAYTAMQAGAAPALPPLPLRYGDFSIRQWRELPEGKIEQAQAYWRHFFPPDVSALRRAGPDPDASSAAPVRYGLHGQSFSSAVVGPCQKAATGQGRTLFAVVLTAIVLLVHKLYGDPRVLVCFATANRRSPEVKPLIGCFFTNIILQLDAGAHDDLAIMLRHVGDEMARTWQLQTLPFELFAGDLGLAATAQRRPPYSVYVSYRNAPMNTELRLPGVRILPIEVGTGRNTREDIVFDFWEGDSQGRPSLDLKWHYRTDRFTSRAVAEASSYLDSLLHRFGTDVVARS